MLDNPNYEENTRFGNDTIIGGPASVIYTKNNCDEGYYYSGYNVVHKTTHTEPVDLSNIVGIVSSTLLASNLFDGGSKFFLLLYAYLFNNPDVFNYKQDIVEEEENKICLKEGTENPQEILDSISAHNRIEAIGENTNYIIAE